MIHDDVEIKHCDNEVNMIDGDANEALHTMCPTPEALRIDSQSTLMSPARGPVFEDILHADLAAMQTSSMQDSENDYNEVAIADSGCTLTAIGREQLPDYVTIHAGSEGYLKVPGGKVAVMGTAKAQLAMPACYGDTHDELTLTLVITIIPGNTGLLLPGLNWTAVNIGGWIVTPLQGPKTIQLPTDG